MVYTKPGILTTLFFCMGQGKNHYTVAAINTILKLLKKFHKIEIGRRWLFQSLKDLTDDGYIKRDTRYVHDNNGLILQIPSMIIFKLKGVAWLSKMDIRGAKELYKAMVTHLNKGDKRFPSRKEFDDGSWWPADPEFRKWLENKCGIVAKDVK